MPSRPLKTELESSLVLAAEECEPNKFVRLHTFASSDSRTLGKLISHGPVLLRGGRGSGKSALLIEAHRRIRRSLKDSAFGVYLSLRYLPLLRATGADYISLFCRKLREAIQDELRSQSILNVTFPDVTNEGALQEAVAELSVKLRKRVILLFDDAAHIGREAPLTEFFDIFRALSTDAVSCKASIYPGVTTFGLRFDVFNDATVIDIARDDRMPDFEKFFFDVLQKRYPALAKSRFSRGLTPEKFSALVGRAVLGNMRAFVFACNDFEQRQTLTLPEISTGLLQLASNYYWPLLEEVGPKLGIYESFVVPSRNLGEKLFEIAGSRDAPTIVVHRDYVQRLTKHFEILEYAGFILRREASRALKSGGRGPMFSLNLCNLLESAKGAQITADRLRNWLKFSGDAAEIHSSGGALNTIELPNTMSVTGPSILAKEIEALSKSPAYPYGLTERKISVLRNAGFDTVEKLASADDEELLRLRGIGRKFLRRIRDVTYQAIWM